MRPHPWNYAAAPCSEWKRVCTRVQREAGIPAIDKREPLQLYFRNNTPADEMTFCSVVLRPAPCKRIPGPTPTAQMNGETPGRNSTTEPCIRTIPIDRVPHGPFAPEREIPTGQYGTLNRGGPPHNWTSSTQGIAMGETMSPPRHGMRRKTRVAPMAVAARTT